MSGRGRSEYQIGSKRENMELMTRRFGTAKRLGKMMNAEKCYFLWDIFDNLVLLMYMKYHLSFGSAKPTRGGLWN